MAQLPLYYKNSKPTGPKSTTKRWKEYYLLVITIVGFIILIAGVLWFVPGLEEDKNYKRAYDSFTALGAVDITDPHLKSTPGDILKRNADVEFVGRKLEQQDIPVPGGGQPDIIKENFSQTKESTPIREGINSDDAEGNHNTDAISEEDVQVAVNHEGDKEDEETQRRREKVVEMARHAWQGYVDYAWGENELRPISKHGHSASIFGKNTRLGATIVDSLDTLYIMGLTDQFNQGKEWVKNSLNLDNIQSDLSVFEMNIRFTGGFLAAYALSGDELFKEKAKQIVDKLLPAFNTPSGIPKSLINFGTGGTKNWGWASGGSSILAEFGSLHLEFQYLSEITGNPLYLEKVNHIRNHLKGLSKPDGLYPNFLNPNSGYWGTKHISLGALGDSFYEYLLKSWLITSKQDGDARDMFYDALNAIERHLVKRTSNGLVYLTDLKNGKPDNKMQHLACFSGGLFALAAQHAINGQSEHYMDIAEGLANVCHESYIRSATKLGPESFRISSNGDFTSRSNEKMYLLRPETVETYFVLWRFTHNQKYRDWGWEVIQALEENCRVSSGGYTGIKDVFNSHAPKDDVQQSFFIAETLKYLYLLYTDDSVYPLDQWVLNTEAHPFPVLSGIPQFKSADLV